MTTYQLEPTGDVLRDDGANIPPDPSNSDWQAYQTWLGQGNTPFPIPDTLATRKAVKQIALDVLFNTNFDLGNFIRVGTATNVSANNIGTFLAQITNNYRTLRASIANAADTTILAAINLNSGWPNNP